MSSSLKAWVPCLPFPTWLREKMTSYRHLCASFCCPGDTYSTTTRNHRRLSSLHSLPAEIRGLLLMSVSLGLIKAVTIATSFPRDTEMLHFIFLIENLKVRLSPPPHFPFVLHLHTGPSSYTKFFYACWMDVNDHSGFNGNSTWNRLSFGNILEDLGKSEGNHS